MSSIAAELDDKLKTLDPETATSVERLVLDALALAAVSRPPRAWPPGLWNQVRDLWGNEPFERPSQGEFEERRSGSSPS